MSDAQGLDRYDSPMLWSTVADYARQDREDAARLAQLQAENPGATIIPPGWVKAIDGKQYWNNQFIIAK